MVIVRTFHVAKQTLNLRVIDIQLVPRYTHRQYGSHDTGSELVHVIDQGLPGLERVVA